LGLKDRLFTNGHDKKSGKICLNVSELKNLSIVDFKKIKQATQVGFYLLKCLPIIDNIYLQCFSRILLSRELREDVLF